MLLGSMLKLWTPGCALKFSYLRLLGAWWSPILVIAPEFSLEVPQHSAAESRGPPASWSSFLYSFLLSDIPPCYFRPLRLCSPSSAQQDRGILPPIPFPVPLGTNPGTIVEFAVWVSLLSVMIVQCRLLNDFKTFYVFYSFWSRGQAWYLSVMANGTFFQYAAAFYLVMFYFQFIKACL